MNSLRRYPLSQGWQKFWAIVGVPLVLLQLLGLAVQLNPYSKKLGDLSQDWLSARCYFDGLFVYTSMDESVPRFLEVPNATLGDNLVVNAHPPTSILFALPFGLLSYPMAKLTWNVLSLIAVAVSTFLLCCRRGLNLDRSNVWPIVALVVCSGPLSAQIINAQFNGFLLLMLTGAWLAQRNGRSLSAGALIGLAASFKLFPLYILLVFACLRDWKAVVSGATTFVLMLALAASVFGIEPFRVYVSEVMPEVANWRGAWLNSSLTGFWSRLFDPANRYVIAFYDSPQLAKLAIGVCSLIITTAVGYKAWCANDTTARDLAFATGVLGMLLLSPTTWDHYWLMLVLPLAVLWWQARWSAVETALLWIGIALLGLVRPDWIWRAFLGFNHAAGIVPAVSPWQSLLVLAIPTYCLLMLLCLALTRQSNNEAQATLD